MDTPVVVLAGAMGVATSCVIAMAASGWKPNTWGWGLLGPPGWVVAGLVGVQRRLDELRPQASAGPSYELTPRADPASVRVAEAVPARGPNDFSRPCRGCKALIWFHPSLMGRAVTCGSCASVCVFTANDQLE